MRCYWKQFSILFLSLLLFKISLQSNLKFETFKDKNCQEDCEKTMKLNSFCKCDESCEENKNCCYNLNPECNRVNNFNKKNSIEEKFEIPLIFRSTLTPQLSIKYITNKNNLK